MNSIFGDASTMAPTPETLAQAESIFSGNRSPVSFRLGDQEGEQIPDMDLQPPEVDVKDGKPVLHDGRSGEGIAGWITNVADRIKRGGDDASGGGSGRYKRVGQDDEQ